jgi:MOSC domain-containing protein YiiM
VHGGPDKAVYFYPSEHYATRPREFEENLPTAGLIENTVSVGNALLLVRTNA